MTEPATSTPGPDVHNYFNYFTEIEQRFQQRRGSLLMLSNLDWALIETWRDLGLPLEAVLRGIDVAFDKHEAKKHRPGTRKVNGLAWCSQSVLEAAHQATEAATGTLTQGAVEAAQSGFEPDRISAFLHLNAKKLKEAELPSAAGSVAAESSTRLNELAATESRSLEDLDRTLLVLEQRLFSVLQLSATEEVLVAIREQTSRELAPARSRMQAMQIRQVEQQIIQKRLFEHYNLPRLSLFYMSHA